MKNLCMHCMEPIDPQDETCPCCSKANDNLQNAPFLPQKTMLQQRYMVGTGLEIDGEGLSYIGYDTVKNSKIYIREFFPQTICGRTSDFKKVTARPNEEYTFNSYLFCFLKYFRSIARLRNLPAITAVFDIFEENGTAYIIAEWVDGIRLDKYLSQKGGKLPWDEAKLMFMPIISSLKTMASSGVYHLGICPCNILITPENKIKLIGFATHNLRRTDSPINYELYEGCSALEQYVENYEPSETTDVYGFAATLFLTLCGEYPPAALERKQDDRIFMPQDVLNSLPENVIIAIANALKVYPNDRTLSFEALRIELSNSPVLQVKQLEEEQKYLSQEIKFEVPEPKTKAKRHSDFLITIISCIISLAILISAFLIYIFFFKQTDDSQSTIGDSATSTESNLEETDSSNKFNVPDLVGKNYNDVLNESKASETYNLALISQDFSDSIKEGCVISQVPSYGEKADKGTTIAVCVSKGSKTRILPNIVGKSLSEASKLITDEKLIPIQVSEYNTEYPEGTAIGYKEHKAGDSLDYGSQVAIIVSKGKL